MTVKIFKRTRNANEKGAGAMAKRKQQPITDLRTALQELLALEYIEDGQTLTGAQTIAAALYSKAKDPENPDCMKAIEMIAKITNRKEQLETDEKLFKLTRATQPPTYDLDDTLTQQTRERIRERYSSL